MTLSATSAPTARLAAGVVVGAAVLAVVSAAATGAEQPRDTEAPPPFCSTPSPVHFELFGYEIPRQAFPLQLVVVGDLPQKLSEDDVREAVERAVDAWNEVPCSYAALEWAGRVDSSAQVDDREIPVRFERLGDDRADTLAAATLPTGAPPEGMELIVNTAFEWTMHPEPFANADRPDSERIHLPTVFAHEFGHLLGLAHTDVHSAATMAPRYLDDGSQLELSADDKLGVCELYPAEGSECETDDDCPPGDPCVRTQRTAVCDIYVAEPGEFCALDLQHCADHCRIDHQPTGTGYCSKPCDDHRECPEHFRCLTEQGRDIDASCQFDPDARPEPRGCSTSGAPTAPLALVVIALVGAVRWSGRRAAIRLRSDSPTPG